MENILIFILFPIMMFSVPLLPIYMILRRIDEEKKYLKQEINFYFHEDDIFFINIPYFIW